MVIFECFFGGICLHSVVEQSLFSSEKCIDELKDEKQERRNLSIIREIYLRREEWSGNEYDLNFRYERVNGIGGRIIS